jgi:hypothetical protein
LGHGLHSTAGGPGLSEAEPEKAQAVGSVNQALLSGILVQWLVDPGQAPSAGDLTIALQAITEDMGRVG